MCDGQETIYYVVVMFTNVLLIGSNSLWISFNKERTQDCCYVDHMIYITQVSWSVTYYNYESAIMLWLVCVQSFAF